MIMSRYLPDDPRPTRLKAMFTRSPPVSPSDAASPSAQKSLHKRSDTSTTTEMASGADAGVLEKRTSFLKARRHKSYSSLEKLKPSSLSKLSITNTTRQWSSPNQPSLSPQKSRRSTESEPSWGTLVHHGEVQIVQSSWRKKVEYFVLTERYLLRFKNSKRAAEQFPWILPINAQVGTPDLPLPKQLQDQDNVSGNEAHAEHTIPKCIPLQSIISVQLVNEAPNRIRLELNRYVEDLVLGHSASSTFVVERSTSEPHWLENIGELARKAQMDQGWQPPKELLDVIKDATKNDEMNLETDVTRSNIYFINRRHNTAGTQKESDDSSKDPPTLLVLAIARFKIYLITLSKKHLRRHHVEENKGHYSSFGFVSLVSLTMGDRYESIRLVFRNPQQPPVSIEIGSVHSSQIAGEIYERLQHLVPSWTKNPFRFKFPAALQPQRASPIEQPNTNEHALPSEEFPSIEYKSCASPESFACTLAAYSAAFGIDATDFNYSIGFWAEDSPSIRLRPLESSSKSGYSRLQLIAFLRSLRDNEYFTTVSLADVSLDSLVDSNDVFGDNHICMTPCVGTKIIVTHEELKHASIFIQELSAMVMSSPALKRLDLTSCISKIPCSPSDGKGDDKGSGLVEAIYPLCINQNTNLDWIAFNGIHLSRADVDFIIGLITKPQCRIRGIELAGCQLDTQNMWNILSELPNQGSTLERIDLSCNPGYLDPEVFHHYSWSYCTSMRKLSLRGSTLSAFSVPIPIVPLDVLSAWKLEELHFDKTRINSQTVDTLVEYLQTEGSQHLRYLSLIGCQLDSNQVARILRASTDHGYLHVDLSENGNEDLGPMVEAIAENNCPSRLTLRLLDFCTLQHFESFISAVRLNTCIQNLDISGASVDFLVADSAAVSNCLKALFEENQQLEFLNICGENSRLGINNLGGDVGSSLSGLIQNRSLKALHMSNQKLGLEGANVIADVLRQNSTLRELHISHNNIPLAGLTAIVESLKNNTTVTHISRMDESMASALQAIQDVVKDFSATRAASGSRARDAEEHSMSVNRRLTTKVIGKFGGHKAEPSTRESSEVLSPAEVEKVIASKWQAQQALLEEYLARNYELACLKEMSEEVGVRESVAVSIELPIEGAKVEEVKGGEMKDVDVADLPIEGAKVEKIDGGEMKDAVGVVDLKEPLQKLTFLDMSNDSVEELKS